MAEFKWHKWPEKKPVKEKDYFVKIKTPLFGTGYQFLTTRFFDGDWGPWLDVSHWAEIPPVEED